MYAFPRFATGDPRHAVDLVRDNPFALIVSVAGGVPVATHAPVIIEDPASAATSFAGTTLLGHMARVNPQWRTLEAAPEILVVFSGPHGYVSPAMHGADPSVPTWNYAAVHLTGRAELITDPDGVLDVVERTVRTVEAPRTPEWRPSPESRRTFRGILQGVAAFRLHVRHEQSLFKLSQDQDDGLRGRVWDAFAAGADANPDLADLMSRVDPRGSDRR
ncbi:protease synthase/sporulation negative transcriptional regulator PaiB [Actinomadura vinacea]|uniref:Protease synthase/sporulation negative transcriptional regulator PaiB n=1 Tax=Actinomadura vinacea TaxID=115336 RepID=A0ABN3J3D0_9ACTN